MANITELHDALHFDNRRRSEGDEYAGYTFGIWSIAWAPAGGELIAGKGGEGGGMAGGGGGAVGGKGTGSGREGGIAVRAVGHSPTQYT